MKDFNSFKKWPLLVLVSLLAVVLTAACQPAEIEPGAVLSAASPTPEFIPPTRTPIAEIGEPTLTVTTAEATRPIPTRTPVPQGDIGQTDRREPPREDILQRSFSDSPDGHWQVEIGESLLPVEFEDGVFYYVALNLLSTDGAQSWPLVNEWRTSGLGQDYPRPFSWSADGNRFYYTNVPRPDGCASYVNGSDLWRVDLETGVQEELLPRNGLVVSLAPDEQKLAYGAFGGRGIVLKDLQTGLETEIGQPVEGSIGRMAWSVDSSMLLVTIGQNVCGPDEEVKSAVVVVDWAAAEARVLLGPDDRKFLVREALPDGRFALDRPDGTIWAIDPAVGESSLNTVLLGEETEDLPVGTLFEARPLLYEVMSGQPPRQLIENPIAVSPGDHRYLLRYNNGGQTVLVDTLDGSERVLGDELYGINFMGWPEENLILFGVFLSVEDDGPSLGHLAIYDIAAVDLRVLDRAGLMFGEADLSPDGTRIAFDRAGQGSIYDLENSSLSFFDPTGFAGWTFGEEVRLTSGSWSPDGAKLSWTIGGGGVLNGGWGLATAIFDLTTMTVDVVHPYDPIGRGGWPSAPLWSPDGAWLVVNQWGTTPEAAGLFVMRPDGEDRVQLTEYDFSLKPVWSSAGVLYYSDVDEADQVTGWKLDPLVGDPVEVAVPEGFSRFVSVP